MHHWAKEDKPIPMIFSVWFFIQNKMMFIISNTGFLFWNKFSDTGWFLFNIFYVWLTSNKPLTDPNWVANTIFEVIYLWDQNREKVLLLPNYIFDCTFKQMHILCQLPYFLFYGNYGVLMTAFYWCRCTWLETWCNSNRRIFKITNILFRL